ncbi:MAG: hypothetical protein JNM56_29035 [Planctomycetia bacterium]|nr:hypothetical protein [Planctomycetia bacterium]
MTQTHTLHAFATDAALVAQGRDWLIDCGADALTVEAASALTIARTVDAHYDGGLLQFRDDSEDTGRVYRHEAAGIGFMD